MVPQRFLRSSRAAPTETRLPTTKRSSLRSIKKAKVGVAKLPEPSGSADVETADTEKTLLRELVETLRQQLASSQKEKELADRTMEKMLAELDDLNGMIAGLKEALHRRDKKATETAVEMERLRKEFATEKAYTEFYSSRQVQEKVAMTAGAYAKEREWQRHQQGKLRATASRKPQPKTLPAASQSQEQPRPQQHQEANAAVGERQEPKWSEVVARRTPPSCPHHQQQEQLQQQQRREQIQQERKRQRLPRRRPDAVLVIPAPGVSYMEMYEPVRMSPALEDLQPLIRRGKRTPKDHLKLELQKSVDSAVVCRRVKETLGDKAEVRLIQSMAEIAITGIDCLMREDHVRKAMETTLKFAPSMATIRMFERRDASQLVKVRLPVKEAAVLVQSQSCRCHSRRVP
uniref:Uncharacterized protein n=1 Tax=Anopheles farauti TaxID=69004 RepID=A0A182QLW2_9DIPT